MMSEEEEVNVLHKWSWGPNDDYRARLVATKAGPELELLYSRRHEWVQADHGDAIEAAVIELYRLTNRPQFGPFAPPGLPVQPAWPLVDRAHPPLWTGADEAEAGLLGEPEADAETALPSGSVAGEVDGLLAALGARPAFMTPAEAIAELSRLRELRKRSANRDATRQTVEEGLEIYAKLIANLIALLGELTAENRELDRERLDFGERLVFAVEQRDRLAAELAAARASADHNARGWEEEASATFLARKEGRREGLGLAGELVQGLLTRSGDAARDWRAEILECSSSIGRLIAAENPSEQSLRLALEAEAFRHAKAQADVLAAREEGRREGLKKAATVARAIFFRDHDHQWAADEVGRELEALAQGQPDEK
jgi:hypothetical protein